jgi:hypothetical protein
MRSFWFATKADEAQTNEKAKTRNDPAKRGFGKDPFLSS